MVGAKPNILRRSLFKR